MCIVGGVYACMCACACRSIIAGGRDLRCRFYGYRANGLGIYVHLLHAALRYSGGSDLAVNNIPAEGTGAKETEEVWWWGEGCKVQRRTEVKEKQRIPLYVRVIYINMCGVFHRPPGRFQI